MEQRQKETRRWKKKRYFNYRTNNKNSKTAIHLHWLIVENVKNKRERLKHIKRQCKLVKLHFKIQFKRKKVSCFKLLPHKRYHEVGNERAEDTIMFSSLLVATINTSTKGGVKLVRHLFIIILI